MKEKHLMGLFIFNFRLILSIGIFMILNLTSCKYSSKVPQEKYDLTDLGNVEKETTTSNDTIFFLTLSGGYMSGIERNYYSIKKESTVTIVTRTSNHQKFKSIQTLSSNFPWKYVIDNYDKLVTDTIKTKRKIITAEGKTVYEESSSHDRTTVLNVRLGPIEHEIYLTTLTESINEGNENLKLIEKIIRSLDSLNFKPSERIKYKRER